MSAPKFMYITLDISNNKFRVVTTTTSVSNERYIRSALLKVKRFLLKNTIYHHMYCKIHLKITEPSTANVLFESDLDHIFGR
jgi:hypothetical protein